MDSIARARTFSALYLLALGAACDAQIVRQPGSDGDSASSSTGPTNVGGSSMGGSSAGGAGAGGAGGSGMGGGGHAPGVVGCEKLVLHPEQLVFPDGAMGHILPIDDQDLAVLYRASSDVPNKTWDTRSRRLLGAFDAWPPPMTEPLIHGSHRLDFQDLPHGRSDGAFAYLGFEGYAIGSFYDASVDVRAPAGQAGAYPILEPSGGGVFWSHEGAIAYYPSLDALDPAFSDTLPTATSKRAHGVGLESSTLFVQDGENLFVQDGGFSPFVTIPGLSNNGHVFRRPGGFYWRLQNDGTQNDGTLYPYANATPLPPVTPLDGLDFTPGIGSNRMHAAPWRNGVVLAGVGSGETPGNRLVVAVTDEVNTTHTLHGFDEIQICQNGVSVAASPDGNSLYVGYLWCPPSNPAFVVRRFDCVSE